MGSRCASAFQTRAATPPEAAQIFHDLKQAPNLPRTLSAEGREEVLEDQDLKPRRRRRPHAVVRSPLSRSPLRPF